MSSDADKPAPDKKVAPAKPAEKKAEEKEPRQAPEYFKQILDSCSNVDATIPETGDVYLTVPSSNLVELIRYLKETPGLKFEMLESVAGVDGPENMRVVYHLYSFSLSQVIQVSVSTTRNDPKVPTITGLFSAADWHERETYDLFGIIFEGHPNLKRILLPEDWEGWPLRKDYVSQEIYHGISMQR